MLGRAWGVASGAWLSIRLWCALERFLARLGAGTRGLKLKAEEKRAESWQSQRAMK
ncbi:MAG: hypothetical protein AVDCRST_MAG01-01-4610 [uncultured Rubrobacteraceae bacterium]|uniref:Uncharacterized protein n=1 Tax=uncultured Rubrobacteraceae bacterium TaxID=349277 RepID=A0A6J4QT21_9ACTN|nr:MAG: hypothetical protein AVDCRST_MAG01-01-4610 [uncultured Rubrobacteraceae bacterium]